MILWESKHVALINNKLNKVLFDANRLSKEALEYKTKGRRNLGRPRKRWRDQLHLEDQGTGNTPNPSGTW